MRKSVARGMSIRAKKPKKLPGTSKSSKESVLDRLGKQNALEDKGGRPRSGVPKPQQAMRQRLAAPKVPEVPGVGPNHLDVPGVPGMQDPRTIMRNRSKG